MIVVGNYIVKDIIKIV